MIYQFFFTCKFSQKFIEFVIYLFLFETFSHLNKLTIFFGSVEIIILL